jgi:hypothetical protein
MEKKNLSASKPMEEIYLRQDDFSEPLHLKHLYSSLNHDAALLIIMAFKVQCSKVSVL